MKRAFRFPFSKLLFALPVAFWGCSSPPPLPDYGAVPPFTMTDSKGHSFESGRLRNKVWVADFIYTTCPAECPMMSAKMHGVVKQVEGDDRIKFVSISVDPRRDTPAKLDEFAGRYGGASEQWMFLTGAPETVHELAFVTFHVGDLIDKMNHSTKFTLVDKRGHIRGYYSSLGSSDLPALVKDAKVLANETN